MRRVFITPAYPLSVSSPPQTAFAASEVSRRTKLIFSIVDCALAMPTGVVLPLTGLSHAFLPVGFITHRDSVRRQAGQWLTQLRNVFQENFLPARTHLYGGAESFSDPRPPVSHKFAHGRRGILRLGAMRLARRPDSNTVIRTNANCVVIPLGFNSHRLHHFYLWGFLRLTFHPVA